MRIAKILPFGSIFILAVAVSFLTAGESQRCSSNAPCFTIANRLGSAGLAVGTLTVLHVYRNGRLLTKGPGADYQTETGAHGKIMVIVHMPANTTGKPELFQVISQ
jgi:hypothetical protein